MKKLCLFALSLAAMLTSCRYDDTDVWNSIGDIYERISRLEAASLQAQQDLEALRILTEQLCGQVTVASVMRTENGYIIRFSDGQTAVISDGTDGITPPSVSVVEDGGVYWWVYVNPDGTFTYIYDKEGNRIPASGRDGTAPLIRINPDTGEWETSTDGGRTWNPTGVKAEGEDGDSFFSGVTEDEDTVTFTLADGTVITLVKSKELILAFEAEGEQFFAFGEERTFGITVSGVSEITVAKPDGWRAVMTADGISVTAPVEENAYAELQGPVSVIGFAAGGRSVMATLDVKAGLWMPDVYEDLSANGTANCYIVNAAGGYSFDATVMGNGDAGAAVGGVVFPDYGTLDPSGARIVWMTSPNLIRSVSVENGRIRFVAPEPFAPGNALIAACDEQGETVWSWHIWLAGFDPQATCQQYDNGFVMMDRNLGAVSAEPGDAGAFGLYYQWGRKDPFVGPDGIYTSSLPSSSTCRQPVYDGAGRRLDPYDDFPIAVSAGDGSIGSVAYATAHPETFIKGKNASDWYDGAGTGADDRNNALWGNPDGTLRSDVAALAWEERTVGSTLYLCSEPVVTRRDGVPGDWFTYYYEASDRSRFYSYAFAGRPSYETGRKSIYDPCPPGYRIPSSGMWSGFAGASAAGEAKAPGYFLTGWDAAGWGRRFVINTASGATAWWPAGGDLNYGTNRFENNSYGKYWTNDALAAGSVLSYMSTDDGSLYDGYYYRRKAGDPVAGTKAVQSSFHASGFSSNSFYLPPLATVDGEPKPTAGNAAKIGAQMLDSGGAVRGMACNVRCMKE